MQRRLPDGTIVAPPEELLSELLKKSRKGYSEKTAGKNLLLRRPEDMQGESAEKHIQRLLQHQPQLAKQLDKSKKTSEQEK